MSAARAAGARPNIVLIFADDLGYSDLGCFGAEIATPNLDALAQRGVRLTQMYNAARCCPSRASLLTGMHPHQAGIGHMVVDLGEPAYQGYLRDDVPTLPEMLRASGYATRMIGKWHVGGSWGTDPATWTRQAGGPGHPRPLDRGFDHYFGTIGGAGSYFDPHTLMSDNTFVRGMDPDFYYTDVMGDQAGAAIDGFARSDDPFFLYIAHVAPHWPLHARDEDIERGRGRYRGGWDPIRTDRHERALELGVVDEQWGISPRDPNAPPWDEVQHKEWEDERMAVYAGQVHALDRSVGQVMEALRRNGLEDETLVVFLSDNGGCAELLQEEPWGSMDIVVPETRDGRPVRIGNDPDLRPGGPDTYMSYALPWANVSNTPFRLFKSQVHEGGISTPFVASWPAGIPAGTIADAPCHLVDLVAAMLEVAGAERPGEWNGRETDPAPGESILPLLCGKEWSRDEPIFWEHEGNRAVRDGDWKLVSRWRHVDGGRYGPWELYDIGRDRAELDDRAATEPERVREMATRWEDWARALGVRPWSGLLPLLLERAGGV